MKKSFMLKLAIGLFIIPLVIYCYMVGKSTYDEHKAKGEFLMSVPHDLSVKPVTNEETCGCSRKIDISHGPILSSGESTCDYYATSRGPGQKIVSFSLYGIKSTDNKFLKGIATNLESIKEGYPGWITRVYHSIDMEDDSVLISLCQLWCTFPTLDFCQVGRLPPPLKDQSIINGMIWRFFPLGDPLVERFIVRDLDSVVEKREVLAVTDWMKSNLTWHFMSDHPAHDSPILGGMWGGVNKNLQENIKLRQQLIGGGLVYAKGSDQELLVKYLKPIAERNIDYLNHNSYYCGESMSFSVAWPVRRVSDLDYVGRRIIQNDTGVIVECPKRCRPPNHQDWLYC